MGLKEGVRRRNSALSYLVKRIASVHCSYFVGVDWIKEEELAVQVSPKMNDGFEIDYVRMLNEALAEPDNMEHLKDLLTIRLINLLSVSVSSKTC